MCRPQVWHTPPGLATGSKHAAWAGRVNDLCCIDAERPPGRLRGAVRTARRRELCAVSRRASAIYPQVNSANLVTAAALVHRPKPLSA